MGINNHADTLPKHRFFNKRGKLVLCLDGIRSKSRSLLKENMERLASVGSNNVILQHLLFWAASLITSPFHLKENSTAAQRDGGDINFSVEPEEKAHASTKLPFGLEGRAIFHLEPKRNAKDGQRGCPPGGTAKGRV